MDRRPAAAKFPPPGDWNAGACYRCGRIGHSASQCSLREATCHNCGKKGHLARVCRARGNQKPHNFKSYKWSPLHANAVDTDPAEDRPLPDDAISTLHCQYQVSGKSPTSYQVVMQIGGKPVEMEVDTGVTVSIISKEHWLVLFPKVILSKPSVSLHTYTTQPIRVVGQADVPVQYGEYSGTLRLYVVQGSGLTLLGRDWLSCIQLDWTSIRVVALDMATPGHLIKKYQDVFEPGSGRVTQLKSHLSLKEQVEPRFCKPRPVPFAIRNRVGKELDRLEESGYSVELIIWSGLLRLCPCQRTGQSAYVVIIPIPQN